MNRQINLSGHKFGLLSVVKFMDIISGRSIYECKCDCGSVISVKAKYLLNGDTKSCGCLKIIKCSENGKKRTTHGLTKHPLFKVWSSMKDRCLNKDCHAYSDYGGRGIMVEESWMDFQTFFNDVSPTYRSGLELDRYPNNDGNYASNNFRWATPTENKRNKRNTLYLTIDGLTKAASQWASEMGINRASVWCRIKRGLSGKEALFGDKIMT